MDSVGLEDGGALLETLLCESGLALETALGVKNVDPDAALDAVALALEEREVVLHADPQCEAANEEEGVRVAAPKPLRTAVPVPAAPKDAVPGTTVRVMKSAVPVAEAHAESEAEVLSKALCELEEEDVAESESEEHWDALLLSLRDSLALAVLLRLHDAQLLAVAVVQCEGEIPGMRLRTPEPVVARDATPRAGAVPLKNCEVPVAEAQLDADSEGEALLDAHGAEPAADDEADANSVAPCEALMPPLRDPSGLVVALRLREAQPLAVVEGLRKREACGV